MWLGTNRIRVLNDPTWADVDEALSSMKEDGDYVILTRGEAEFMQSIPGCIEYREGDYHYRADTNDPAISKIIDAFRSYLDGDERWRTMFVWRDVTDEVAAEAESQWDDWLVAIVVAVVVAVLVWLKCKNQVP